MKSKILVIDDSEDIRILLQKKLAGTYSLSMAENCEQAISCAIESSPDIILLDIILPEISGYEICTQLKSIEKLKDTPIIFLSSKSGSESRTAGYKLGAIQYIEKPFEINELKEVIRSVLKNTSKSKQKDTLDFEDISLNIHLQEVTVTGERVHFTSSEFKIILLLLKNINLVLGRDKILAHIAPDNDLSNDRMIDTYISSLRRKIKKSNFRIKSIYGKGYKIIA